MRRPSITTVVLSGSIALAGVTGFAVSTALGQGSAATARTVTVNVGTGPAGPAGPTGPAGPAGPEGQPGEFTCPTGWEPGYLRINGAGGQQTIYTCITVP